MGRPPRRAAPLAETCGVRMRRTSILIAWLLIAAAVIVVLGETYEWLDKGSYHITAASELWSHVSPGSLRLLQAAVKRYIAAAVWDDVLGPLLSLPAWLLLAAPGIAILALRRKRRRRRRTLTSR